LYEIRPISLLCQRDGSGSVLFFNQQRPKKAGDRGPQFEGIQLLRLSFEKLQLQGFCSCVCQEPGHRGKAISRYFDRVQLLLWKPQVHQPHPERRYCPWRGINATLAKEGLHCESEATTKHILEVLHDDIGITQLRARLKRTFRDLKIATHYGCHILRPSKITRFDNPFKPKKFDQLVALTGADPVSWLTKLECCGAPVAGVNDDLSMDLAAKKLMNAKKAGADYLCVSCPFCQMQFDRVQSAIIKHRGSDAPLPSLVYTQLLGLCLGLSPQDLGMETNILPIIGIQQFLGEKSGDGGHH